MRSLSLQPPPPPAPPAPPSAPVLLQNPAAVAVGKPDAPVLVNVGTGDPAEMLRSLREQRRELRGQLQSLESKRSDLRRELQSTTDAEVRSGLIARLREIDARILATDAQLATADVAVARAAGIPGATVPAPVERRDGPPEAAIIMSGMVLMATLVPISIAFARRLWRRGSTPPAIAPDVARHLDSLSQAVESMGLEVERIGEGQRFMTRVLADQKPVGSRQ